MNTKENNDLTNLIKAREKRKIKERRKTKNGFWYGLGMFGLVGWSVAVPTLLGIMLGNWLDKRLSGTQSWTLTFLIAGLVIGCFIAWCWLSKEHKEIHKEENNE
jgi:ATP synthase protein I